MRKNFTRQYSKRPWRTPSPSSHSDLRSPQHLKAGFMRLQSNKQLKVDTINENKSKPMLSLFRNQIIQLKQKGCKVSNSQASQNKHPNQHEIQKEQMHQNHEIDPYNSYFAKTPPVYSTLMNNYGRSSKSKNNGLKNEPNSHSGTLLSNNNQSYSRQKDSIKRLTDQNIKLKKNVRQLQQNLQKLLQKNKKLEEDIPVYRSEKQLKNQQLNQNKFKEGIQIQQIKKLKGCLQISNNQVNNSNFQIYKMKQELFQYQISAQKQRNQRNSASVIKSHEKSKSTSKTNSIIQTQNPRQSSTTCSKCRISQKTIISLCNTVENKIFELMKKDCTIQQLLSDLNKAEQQLKMFDKPKAIFKKMSSIMQTVNQSTMLDRMKRLNLKYSGG